MKWRQGTYEIQSTKYWLKISSMNLGLDQMNSEHQPK